MRRTLSFTCTGSTCWATLDESAGSAGLLIVSGGNEIRTGAHRGMAMLAADMAAAGHPVFRFDRRGIGDSEGENGEFASSAEDIAAALVAFKEHCPHVTHVVAFGNCDAASALLLHPPQTLSALVLGNIWVIEAQDDMPPPAAIKARYIERMKDPKAWIGLFTGAIDLRKLAGGLFKLAKPSAPRVPTSLLARVADGLAKCAVPAHILLAKGDATALAFADEWTKPVFEAARSNARIKLTELNSNSHSFASEADYAALKSALMNALSGSAA